MFLHVLKQAIIRVECQLESLIFFDIFDLEEEDETINGGSEISREKYKKMSSW
jgi:hypothetical protein